MHGTVLHPPDAPRAPTLAAGLTGPRPCPDPQDRAGPLRTALQKHGLWTPAQTAARRWSMGCISLEVTQRCNLDCTLCYLSEHSEAVRDVPLEELFRRIDQIAQWYGPLSDVQISGGDPTLRSADDLEAIVRRIRSAGMRCSLFTNGILASRALLSRLAAAGLNDVAFHVDLTQQRPGYASEVDLHALRDTYIERARGLGMAVLFNTSVYAGNVDEVPALARFFVERSDVVSFASFQMQAATGRGTLRNRTQALTQERMMALINQGAGDTLSFDALVGGHPQCNRYATALTLGRGDTTRAFDLFRHKTFIARAMRETQAIEITRGQPLRATAQVVAALAQRPRLAWQGLVMLADLAWRARHALWRSVHGVRKVSFFIHNFMDASALDSERLETCVFMAATQRGPMPMCEFNAIRDQVLLQPLTLADGQTWQPLEGRTLAARGAAPRLDAANQPEAVARVYPIKFLKGRARVAAAQARRAPRSPS
jgi:7,8-dihydro-6-hydroxymethylpterin dimethyltransferase